MQRPAGPKWDQGPRGPRDWLSHVVKKPVMVATDRGWFGRTPLEMHLVICGFPRTGSTVLQLVLETCLEGVLGTHGEMSAIRVARMKFRNHRLLVSKRPKDLYYVDRTREYYTRRRAEVRFLLTVRDPRDTLTSVHRSDPDNYFVTPETWDMMYSHFVYCREAPDCMVVRYEDFTGDPDSSQDSILAFIGQKATIPFKRYHESPVENRNAIALNGLRPLSASNVGRWKAQEHRDRIRKILRKIPGFAEKVVSLGYEEDERWTAEYR